VHDETGVDYITLGVSTCGACLFLPLAGPPAGMCPVPCTGDVDGDGAVAVGDLVAVILAWGPCAGCAADVNGDGTVDVQDLVEVILHWGPCR
jgi:hypothetical protein